MDPIHSVSHCQILKPEEPDTVEVVAITKAGPASSSAGPSSSTMAGVWAFCNLPGFNQTSASLVARYHASAVIKVVVVNVTEVEAGSGNL